MMYYNVNYIYIVFPTRARLSFLLIYTTDLCLKGSIVKSRSGLGMEDGAAFLFWNTKILT